MFGQKMRVKTGGKIRISETVFCVFTLKKQWTGKKDFASKSGLDQISVSGGVVIVTVTDYNGIQILKTNAQPARVAECCAACAAVKQESFLACFRGVLEAMV